MVEDTNLNEKVDKFWDLESIGIKSEAAMTDKRRCDVKFVDKRYVVGLPWKTEHPILGDNYALAERRLAAQLIKLKKRPDLLEK